MVYTLEHLHEIGLEDRADDLNIRLSHLILQQNEER